MFTSTQQDSASLETLIGPLSDYDIFLGVHGAQLTNILYGKEGLVLVEVTNASWDKVRNQFSKQLHWNACMKTVPFPFRPPCDLRGEHYFIEIFAPAYCRSGVA